MENAYLVGNYSHINTLSSKILSTIFKEICARYNIKYGKADSHISLYNKVKNFLNLDAKVYQDLDNPLLRNFSSYLEDIVSKLNELRNLYSDSHGTDHETFISVQSISVHHYKLIADSTKTIANFLISTYNFQNGFSNHVEF